MKFWFSGELDHRISDAYRPVSKVVETKLNRMCDGRDYGDAVATIAIIPMILSAEFLPGMRERRLWKRKEGIADYRTFIDFESFRRGDDRERERLLVLNTLAAVRDLHRKAGKAFRGDELIADITREFGLSVADVPNG